MPNKIRTGQITDSSEALVSWAPTVTGFSSITSQSYRYTRLGKLVTLYISIIGTSNSAYLSVSLPVTARANTYGLAITGDATANCIGAVYIETDMNTLRINRGNNTANPFGNWATSGAKTIGGVVFTYEAA